MSNEIILSIDTAMAGCGVGLLLLDEQGTFQSSYEKQEKMAREQAARLIPMVQDVVKDACVEFKDISAIITTIGPGTFTGLRLGMSAARSFALALDIPIYGITTLQALALAYVNDVPDNLMPITVLVETKRKDFYAQIFSSEGRPQSEPIATDANDVFNMLPEETVLVGDAVKRFCDENAGNLQEENKKIDVSHSYTLPNPITIAKSYRSNYLVSDPDPLYLRGADVSLPKNAPRKIERCSGF